MMTTIPPSLVDMCRDIERVIFGDDLRVDTANRDHIIEAIHKSVIGGSYDWTKYEWQGNEYIIHRKGGNIPMSYYYGLWCGVVNDRRPSKQSTKRDLLAYMDAYRRPHRNFAADTPDGLWLCHRVLIPAMSNEQRREFALRLLQALAEQEPHLAHNEPVLAVLRATPSQIVEAAWRAIGGSGDGK